MFIRILKVCAEYLTIVIVIVNYYGLHIIVSDSSPVRIVEGDQAGVVYDGPDMTGDVDFQIDETTATASFRGFHSVRDGIRQYLWAVGTQPYGDDVLAYTSYGIVESIKKTDDGKAQNLLNCPYYIIYGYISNIFVNADLCFRI